MRPIPASRDQYVLEVTAVDDGQCCGGGTRQSSQATLTVEVVDAVNQKPAFPDCYTQQYNVTENMQPGDLAFTVIACCCFIPCYLFIYLSDPAVTEPKPFDVVP